LADEPRYIYIIEKRTNWLDEENERHDEHCRVEDIGLLVALPKDLQPFVVSLVHDFLVKRIARSEPVVAMGARKRPFIGQTQT
jgi:hypothetical protein